jgi:hypothetical protein
MSTLQEIEAAVEKLPPSEVAKLAAWLARHSPAVSAYEAMQDGCGIVKTGPRDLATNQQHGAGYGR